MSADQKRKWYVFWLYQQEDGREFAYPMNGGEPLESVNLESLMAKMSGSSPRVTTDSVKLVGITIKEVQG
jgi:hypothetical protein